MIDPLKFAAEFWPDVTFYKEQCDIIRSVWEDDETVVPAGNMLGKDFVGGFIAVAYFMLHYPCRVVTSSVSERHMDVLWNEMNRFIQTCKYPLTSTKGGPWIVNHRHIRRTHKGQLDTISYIKGIVPEKPETLQGHHARHTLWICDEASGAPNSHAEMADTWQKPGDARLVISNPWPCENFFKHAVMGRPGTKDKGGNLFSDDGKYCYRRVIKIRGEDSPNVRLGIAEEKAGKKPSHREVVPGVLSYAAYLKRRQLWSAQKQCVSLDAEFYVGAAEMLFPREWLDHSNQIASHRASAGRRAWAGIDPAEGGDNTSMVAIDEFGVIDIESCKTPNTSVIPDMVIDFARKHGIAPEDVYFDMGGGGKEHVDFLGTKGFFCKGVRFGSAPTAPRTRAMTPLVKRDEQDDTRYVYKNRRAEMYHLTSLAMNPDTGPGFGIPAKYTELRRQLAPIPRLYDGEGRLYLPPKNARKADSDEVTMRTLIGCSPDEADALVLAVFGWKKGKIPTGGGVLF